jgi:hypothetical protein
MAEDAAARRRARLARGEPVDLRPTPGATVDAGQGGGWGADRTVAAAMLAELLTAPVGGEGWTHRPLRLAGARITGLLDLQGATLTRSLDLADCHFESSFLCEDAQAIAIRLVGCHLPGFSGPGLSTRGHLRLADGFTATGKVNLLGAHIGGNLDCDGATFGNPGGTALNGDKVTVAGSMFCRDGFAATGEVNLIGARIGSNLECDSGTFSNPDGIALNGDGVNVAGSMFCRHGFAATGEVNLLGARIGGNLECDGATFGNPRGIAFNADRISIQGSVFCRHGFAAEGEVRLIAAHVGSNLECDRATISNPGGTALQADSMVIAGSMFCRNGFAATGDVTLIGTRIGGNLECDGSTFTNPEGKAIYADSLTVEGSVFLRQGFAATGEVNLLGARIGASLDCVDGSFANPDGMALTMYRAGVGSAVWFRPASVAGAVQLSFARVGAWYDSARTWPRAGTLYLNGFTYAAIDAYPAISVRQRLTWLRKDPDGFLPQPYEQLATVYRAEGSDQHARQVQISAQWHRRILVKGVRDLVLWPLRVFWSVLLALTIGYGYRPWRILVPIGALYAFGCWWFKRAADQHTIVPAKDLNPEVHFNAARYTADLLIPGASLGERAHFLATGATAWWTAGYTLAGWALAAMLIAGLTGVFKRQ